ICPNINTILEKHLSHVSDCMPITCDDMHYQIKCYDGSQFTVDLEKIAILAKKLVPIDFVDGYYSQERYRNSIIMEACLFIPLYLPTLGGVWQAFKGKKKRARRDSKERKKEKREASNEIEEATTNCEMQTIWLGWAQFKNLSEKKE
ncbi:hypothetical protein STAS_19393, partial [Striga asiatica]